MIYFRNICFGILGEDLFVVDLNKIVAFHCENDLEKFAVDLKNYGFSHLLASNLGRKRFVIFGYRRMLPLASVFLFSHDFSDEKAKLRKWLYSVLA